LVEEARRDMMESEGGSRSREEEMVEMARERSTIFNGRTARGGGDVSWPRGGPFPPLE